MTALPRGQRGEPASLLLDGYTADEQGARNTPLDVAPDRARRIAMLNKSRFTTVVVSGSPTGANGTREVAQDVRVALPNRADPAKDPSLKLPQKNIPAGAPNLPAWLYLSPAAAALAGDPPGAPSRPVQVSILYAVSAEMNRHGLRSFFEAGSAPRALITVSGVEPDPGGPRWGIAIADTDIRAMLQTALQRDVAFEVKVMAAFSTGINGLNQTLLNDLVGVTALERIVVYDCLYSLSSGSTGVALAQARRRCGSRLKLVAYKCTTGGNSLERDGRLSVVAANPGLFSSDGVIENLFYTPGYTALIMFRSLEGGIADNSVELPAGSALAAAFAAMKAVVPKRGAMLSSKRAFAHVFGTSRAPAGKVFFDDWAAGNAKVITTFLTHLGSRSRAGSIREIVWGAKLPGWAGGAGDGEENHDLLLPDFAHEFLPA